MLPSSAVSLPDLVICKPVDIAALRALTDTMRARPVATGDWLRRSRDEERY